MPHDIIDNRTRELAPEINNFLADSIRPHFAVGYFFLSGFQAIAEHIPHLDQLRLLIGNVTNRQTIEQLAEGYHHLATLQRAVRREWMAGAQHDFLPDFLVRLTNRTMLMLEVKGYEKEQDRAKYEAARRWAKAVTHWGEMGRWVFEPCKQPSQVKEILKRYGA